MNHDGDENGEFKYAHSSDMKVQLNNDGENWVHPSLCTPKSLNHNISLNLACQKYIQMQNPNLNIILEN